MLLGLIVDTTLSIPSRGIAVSADWSLVEKGMQFSCGIILWLEANSHS